MKYDAFIPRVYTTDMASLISVVLFLITALNNMF